MTGSNRRRLSGERNLGAGPNLTPLVDVVLVVLIFLMLAGNFGDTSHYLQSKLSGPGHSRTSKPMVPPPASLDLYLHQTSAGLVIDGAGLKTVADVSSLKPWLSGRARAFNQAGTAPTEVGVVLHADGNVHYQQLMAVYDATGRAGFGSVSLATRK